MTLGQGHNGGPPLSDDEARERPGNWFAVSRDIFDHPIIGVHDRSFTDMEAWLYLLSIAAYQPTEVANKGAMIVLDPGQMMAAHAYLAERWRWSADKVRWYLKRLEKEAMITRFASTVSTQQHTKQDTKQDTNHHTNQSTKRNTNQIQIITICNYSIYQYVQTQLHQAKHQPLHQSSHQPEHQASHQESNTIDNLNTKKGERDAAIAAPIPPPPVVDASSAKVEQSPTPDLLGKPEHEEPSVVSAFEAFRRYNDLAQRIGLPLARTLTPQRRKNLVARLREHGGMEAWEIALGNVERSAFLRGRNNRGWVADFDFLVTASKFAKVIDGTYGNGAHAPETPRESLEEEALRLAAEMEGRV